MTFGLSAIFKKSNAKSRSLSAENVSGEPGKGGMATVESSEFGQAARDLGTGWKVSPCLSIEPGNCTTLMDNDGPGIIRHIWITMAAEFHRDLVLRVYWDNEEAPSIESPIGDFFCQSWKKTQDILAIPINVNPNGGMNCFLPMPFRRHARVTVTNESPNKLGHFFFTINYTLEDVPEDALYLHASWRRTNPVAYKNDYTMIDGIKGAGQYVGTFMSWQQNSTGWWGEGEIKMYLDGDTDYPTICGTGTEDYFGGAWCFGRNYSAPFFGYQDIRASVYGGVSPEGPDVGRRMTLYRFHIADPVYFDKELRVTMQALGWRSEGRFLPLQDDISSVVYWYQSDPHVPFPTLPDRDYREVI